MIRVDLIKAFAVKCNYYSKKIGPYIVPKYVTHSKGKVDLIKNRLQELGKRDSSYVSNFKTDIVNLGNKTSGNLPKYIEEFPIVIDNSAMWNSILDYYNVPVNSVHRSRKYFLLDFLFYELGFIVEIDSAYHIGNESYDKARDLYIKQKYGLDTIRFYEYGVVAKDCATLESVIDKYCELCIDTNTTDREYCIDQSNVILENYIAENKLQLEIIENIFNYTGSSQYVNKIAITMKDVKIIIRFLHINCDTYQETVLIENIIFIVNNVYKIDLYIQDTMLYRLNDVLWIKEMKKHRKLVERWNNLCLITNSNKFPKWMTVILGNVPRKLEKYIEIDETGGNGGIEDFLKALSGT